TSMGGLRRDGIAALDATTGAATSWNPGAGGGPFPNPTGVLALAASAGKIYAGGEFSSIGGQARNFIAALDSATGAATSWNPNANGLVRTVAVDGGTVYAGGEFTSVGGRGRNYIAALDTASGAATGWNPNANANVFAIATSGDAVYTGGQF